MAKIPYLFRRKNTFYFRVRIPYEYQELLEAKEVVQSLKTENQAEAISVALKLAALFKSAFHDHKTGKAYLSSYSELLESLDAD